jgi:hypothetical protein
VVVRRPPGKAGWSSCSQEERYCKEAEAWTEAHLGDLEETLGFLPLSVTSASHQQEGKPPSIGLGLCHPQGSCGCLSCLWLTHILLVRTYFWQAVFLRALICSVSSNLGLFSRVAS